MLEVTRADYDTRLMPFQIQTDEPNDLGGIKLQRSTGSLVLNTAPPDATIVIRSAAGASFEFQGRLVESLEGRSPLVTNGLPTGQYIIAAQLSRWSAKGSVVIGANAITQTNLNFPFGSVRVETDPAGAEVWLGNKLMGNTVTNLVIPELDLGLVQLTLRKRVLGNPGYKYGTVTGQVLEQQTNTIKNNLEEWFGPQPGDWLWTNTLGMVFARVGQVYFSIWETRSADYEAMLAAREYSATKTIWKGFVAQLPFDKEYSANPNHPALFVNWTNATNFCGWLTRKEFGQGVTRGLYTYRLPRDLEWSLAAGLPPETGRSPLERQRENPEVYPWGKGVWPPPPCAGNYSDFVTYDRFRWTAPVGSFPPNQYNLYDLGGNVWEWCEDPFTEAGTLRTLRGGSWRETGTILGKDMRESFLLSFRYSLQSHLQFDDVGFRCVLEPRAP
jgi:hypothetical protein